MPDDYYVSQYSGEEIDERLTAAHNAVRYDAAQSLTDAQKKQARSNIAAAPDGYGLGTNAVPIDDYNKAIANGWYRGGNNYPSKISYAKYGMVRVDSTAQPKLQTFYAVDTGNAMISPFMAIRKSNDYGATWSEWEYVNPPMVLGIEYRTTERYLGKPVYCKLVNFGALPNKTSKDVIIASDISAAVSVDVIGTAGALLTNYDGITSVSCSPGAIRIATSVDMSDTSVYCLCKYTKTTD